MESHKDLLQRQVVCGSAPVDLCSSELEAWSPPVLIGLNAAGTELCSISSDHEAGIFNSNAN